MKRDWILGKKFSWVEEMSKIDKLVNCPHLVENFDNNSNVILPISKLQCIVHLVPDFRNIGFYWINWWITCGNCKYPIEHFDKMYSLLSN